MNHESSDGTQRHGKDPHVSIRKSELSRQPGASSQPDPQNPRISEDSINDPQTNSDSLPGLGRVQIGQDPFAVFTHEGPTPLPAIIKQHNDISPGSGDRIMDDAHEDMVLDRKLTESSFLYAIYESKVRLWTAVGLIVAAFVSIPLFLFLLEPPESIVGCGMAGLAASAPLINTLLSSRGKRDTLEQDLQGAHQ